MHASWRLIDTTKECFLLDELAVADSFLTLRMRKTTHQVSYFKIFNRFITDDIMDKLYTGFNPDDLIMQRRANKNNQNKIISHTFKRMKLKMQYMWQSLAVQIRIIVKSIRITWI